MVASPTKQFQRKLLFLGFAVLLLLLPAGNVLSQPGGPTPAQAGADWLGSWGLAPGFALDIDTAGFAFPSAMAFVPEPGPNPDDPLYYVVELRGTVKVVTNDRSIYTFAENSYSFVPQEELPSGYGQGGTGGICLDPKHGYVFLTFLYQDASGQLRNGLIRYTTKPGTFDRAPAGEQVLTPVFEHEVTGLAHFIGSCLVKDDLLYVGVGEAWQPHEAQNLSSVIGKVLRMTLDGEPVPDNPFYEDGDQRNPKNYVWAYGLRNPWGMSFVDDRLFAADNGGGIDRFVEVGRGQDYFWNGQDTSIATNASFVWTPAVGPTQMAYASPESTVFPDSFRDQFLVGTSGGGNTGAAIVSLKFDFAANRLTAPPSYFLRWVRSDVQTVTGVVFGPDGLYFAPLYPGPDGTSPVMKISYDPARGHPVGLDFVADPARLFFDRGCIGCHTLDGSGGFGGIAGPALDRATLAARISQRVNNPAYLSQLDAIDQLTTEPQVAYREAREALRQASGDERVRLWVKYRVLEPRFDTPAIAMPNVGLTENEAAALADYLLKPPGRSIGVSGSQIFDSVNYFFRSRVRVAIAAFAIGLIAAGGAIAGFGFARRRLGKARK